MKRTASTLLIAFMLCAGAEAQSFREEIEYQLDVSGQVTESLDELFARFEFGYIESETAIEKIHIIRNEYLKATEPVPPEAETLHRLMKELFSRIENYFIFFKRHRRVNPYIDIQISQTKYELTKEVIKLNYML